MSLLRSIPSMKGICFPANHPKTCSIQRCRWCAVFRTVYLVDRHGKQVPMTRDMCWIHGLKFAEKHHLDKWVAKSA